MDDAPLRVVARVRSGFPAKFGIPRQSGLVPSARAEIVFEPEFRVPEAVRGLDGFSHIWLLWGFSQSQSSDGGWSPTVRPPRLGGNERMGVFATRSPFRPNPIGLSCVRLERVEQSPDLGPVLHISGADILDGSPVYDIKPYVPYADAIPGATGGFAANVPPRLRVEIPENLASRLPEGIRDTIREILAADPRPAYQDDPERVYGMTYAGVNVRFRVSDGAIHVISVEP